MSQQEKLTQICFWLINICKQTNANQFKTTQEGVTFEGKNLGDWEIIVRKKPSPERKQV